MTGVVAGVKVAEPNLRLVSWRGCNTRRAAVPLWRRKLSCRHDKWDPAESRSTFVGVAFATLSVAPATQARSARRPRKSL
jgi:hypothetical protein